MAYPNRYPTYPKKPHSTGAARIKFKGRVYYLGPFGSAESRAEFNRLLALFAAGEEATPKPATAPVVTIGEVCARWLRHLLTEYDPARVETENCRRLTVTVVRLFKDLPAADFDARRLGELRDALASGSWLNADERERRMKHRQPIGLSRRPLNREIVRVRTMFRWAEYAGLVDRGTAEHLRTLPRIGRQSSRVRTLPDRKPVDWEQAKRVLPHVPGPVAAMLELQHLTGMRPGEVCKIRLGDIDRDAGDGWWILRLTTKNSWRAASDEDGVEWVPLNRESQSVLAPWLERAERERLAYVFCPVRRRGSVERYDKNTYPQAVRRGCLKAKVPHFSPYQLRHETRQRITRTHGLDHARAVLRHRNLTTTSQYARQHDIDLAKRALGEAG